MGLHSQTHTQTRTVLFPSLLGTLHLLAYNPWRLILTITTTCPKKYSHKEGESPQCDISPTLNYVTLAVEKTKFEGLKDFHPRERVSVLCETKSHMTDVFF